MNDINNPTQAATESPSGSAFGDVNHSMTEAEANAGIDNLVADMFGLNESPTQESVEEPEVSEEATESEESSEYEELEEDADVALHDEADDSDESDEGELQDDGEYDIVSYDDLKGLALEIGGEHYTAAQLKSMLGQMKAAGNEARKADQATKELEVREAKLAEQEAWLAERAGAAAKSDQLSELQVEAKKIQSKIEQARSEGDMYELSVQKDKLDVLAKEYQTVQQEVQAVQQQQDAKMYEAAAKGLKDLGMGYLLEDSPQAKAWTDYASKVLQPHEMKAVTMNPQLAALVEKARKYDSASTKKGAKLKTSGKTLKPGVNKTKSVNTTAKKKAEYQANPDAYFTDLAKDILGGS